MRVPSLVHLAAPAVVLGELRLGTGGASLGGEKNPEAVIPIASTPLAALLPLMVPRPIEIDPFLPIACPFPFSMLIIERALLLLSVGEADMVPSAVVYIERAMELPRAREVVCRGV
jgi:hypothetical protein